MRFPPRPWLPPTAPVLYDPLSIGVAILVNIGYAGTISGTLAYIVGGVVIGAAALAASALAGALLPKNASAPKPKPSDRQATIRQSVGPRLRFYGRVKVGGTVWFFESKAGILYTGVTINWGQISAIQEVWLNDSQVTLGGNGDVEQAPYYRPNGDHVANILIKMGESSQTAHAELIAAFPTEVTADHRLRGEANLLARYTEVAADVISEVYPQGNPSTRLVIDASIVRSVRTGEPIWSDNVSDAIYDYLTAVDGAGFPYGCGYDVSEVDLESFQDFADLCDEPVPLKAGGTIKRYRLWGGYAMNEDQRNVLPRMLAAADADLYVNTAGKIAIRGGRWVPPTLTLDSAKGHIISGEFHQGQMALAAYNELTITYTEPGLDYQEAEAQTWRDVANIAMRGEVLTNQLDLLDVPNHAQARRLGKIRTAKDNPEWIGTIITNFYGLNALGEETIHVKFDPLGIDTTFMVRDVRILDDLSGCQISISSLGASAYEWDAPLEEGTGPSDPPDTTSEIDLPPPEDFAVVAKERNIDGVFVGVYLEATWSALDRPALLVEVQTQEDPAGAWVNMSVDQDARVGTSGIVNSGMDYNVRTRVVTPGGVPGDWSTPITVTATP